MSGQLTYVVAPNHRIGTAAARRHGIPVRNVITRAEHLAGMGSGVRLMIVSDEEVGLDRDVLDMLEILRDKGLHDQEQIR